MNHEINNRTVAENESGSKGRKVDPTVYGELVEDPRISHGAFRLWHCLLKHANARAEAWPSQRTIARKIGCNLHSLKGWTRELVQADYLAVVHRGAKRTPLYCLQPRSSPTQPNRSAEPSAQTPAAPRGAHPTGTRATPSRLPKTATGVSPVLHRPAAENRNASAATFRSLTNTKEPSTGTKESLSSTSMNLMSKEIDRVEAKMNHIRSQYDSHQTWDKDERAEFHRLRTRRDELLQLLGFAI